MQSQGHRDHRKANSGVGAGNTVPGPEGRGCKSAQVHPVFCPHTEACSYTLLYTQPMCTLTRMLTATHLHTDAVHASAQAQQVCSPGRSLSRTLLSAPASSLHPSRHLWGKELELWREEGGGRKSGQAALPTSPSQDTLRLQQDEGAPTCPRCPRR